MVHFAIFQSVCLIALALGVAAAAETPTSNYVSVLVTDHCATQISEVIPTSAPASDFFPLMRPTVQRVDELPFDLEGAGMLGRSPEMRQMRYLAVFRDPESGREFAHVFLDPRIRYGDGAHHAASLGEKAKEQEKPVDGGAGGSQENPKAEKTHHSQFFLVDRDAEPIWVPSGVQELTIFCHNLSTSSRHTIATPRRRFAHSLAANGSTTPPSGGGVTTNVTNIRTVGPVETQLNIVFLSAGYRASEKEQFESLVRDTIVPLLMDPTFSNGGASTPLNTHTKAVRNMHATVPINRYLEFFNVYAVFQASIDSGISRPAKGITKIDNLGCIHPATMERAIACNTEKAISLADVSPARVRNSPDRTLIVVIANTRLYGGTGIFRRGKLHLCTFYSGTDEATGSMDTDKFASLINHEMGHAMQNLFDEYDIGISEPTSVPLQNCQAPSSGGGPPTTVQWQHWISIFSNATATALYRGAIDDVSTDANGNSVHTWSVTGTPLRTCGYSNYYKPNTNCMMFQVRDSFMCPVCREQACKTLMQTANFSLQWPRFPLPDPVLVLPQTHETAASVATGAVLHLPSVLTPANGFTVIWTLPDGSPIPASASLECTQCLELSTAVLRTLPTDTELAILASIVDSTNYFLTPSVRALLPGQLIQNATFRIMILSEGRNATSMANTTLVPSIRTSKGNFGRSELDIHPTFQQCSGTPAKPNPLCHLSFTIKVYQVPEDIGGLIAEYDQWVLYLVGGIAVAFLLLWLWAMNYYSNRAKGVVRPIFKTEFTGVVAVIRRIMLFGAVCFMIASVAVTGISVYFYLKSSALGKIIILAGLLFALCLYFMAFIGFWSVSYRSKKLVLLNGVVLFFGLLVLIGCCVLLITIGRDIQVDDSFWTKELEMFWTSLVKDNPERACAIQGMLDCSGFFLACNTDITSSLYCPRFCEVTNQNNPTACRLRLQQYIADNYTTLVTLIGAALGLMGFAIIFNFIYFFKLVQMKRAIRQRNNERVHRHASTINARVQSVDKCKALFILKTLDDGDIDKLVREFKRIDLDGNGQLDRQEFAQFFKKALCYKPTGVEIDEIFRVADLDGDGTISLYEFLYIFNPRAAGVSVSGQDPAKAALKGTLNPEREEELKRRIHKTYGDTGLVSQEMDTEAVRSARPGQPSGGGGRSEAHRTGESQPRVAGKKKRVAPENLL